MQTLHGAEFDGTTRAPTFKPPFTSEPSVSTIPESSCPKTAGGVIIRAWYPRFQTFRSVPQVNATFTRINASSGASVGMSTFSIFRFSLPYKTAAVM